MKTKLYAVISRSVLDGVKEGLNQADGRYDRILGKQVTAEWAEDIHREVMRELSEYVDFEDHE
jgi:hypothetical protein